MDSDNYDAKKRSKNKTVDEGDMVSIEVEEDVNLIKKPPTKRKKKPKDLTEVTEEPDESNLKTTMSVAPRTLAMSAMQPMVPITPPKVSPKSTTHHPMPKQWFRTVLVTFNVNKFQSRDLELEFSTNFVVRSIGRTSPVFIHFLIGDQILEVNGTIPLKLDEFMTLLTMGPVKFVFKVLRPWNVSPPTEPRQPNVRIAGFQYLIVDVVRFKDIKNGFDIKPTARKDGCVVSKVDPNSRGAFAFLPKDKILDIDGIPISKFASALEIRKKFNDMMARSGICSFLVERAISLSSSQNPSVYAKRMGPPVPPPPINPSTGAPILPISPAPMTISKGPEGEAAQPLTAVGSCTNVNAEFDMGDDAVEIGCREACRHEFMKDKYKPVSAIRDHLDKQSTFATEDEEEAKMNAKKKRSKKKSRRKIVIESKNEVFRTPSDVRDPSTLQKVTAESDLIRFVKNYIGR